MTIDRDQMARAYKAICGGGNAPEAMIVTGDYLNAICVDRFDPNKTYLVTKNGIKEIVKDDTE